MLDAIRDIILVIEGNLSEDDAKAAVITAWMALQVEYASALDYSGEEETDEELDSFQAMDGLLWEALHDATGAMVEGDPNGIEHAMDSLRRWWEQSR